MAEDPVEAFRRTARVERDQLPAVVEQLDPEEAARLTGLLQDALDRRHDEIVTSIDQGMGMVPRPLRGPVKKALGV